MKGLLNWWENACRSAGPLRFVDIILRGIGQVMFQDNPVSGLFFFVAIGWGSYAANVPQVALGGLLGIVVATITAWWLRVDRAALGAGLYGFNAYLVGIALPTFLTSSALLWLYIVLGAMVSVVATLAATNLMKTWGVSALTAPFILVRGGGESPGDR
jgi:urea transporter